MLKKNYEIIPNAPDTISWDDYSHRCYEEYRLLLQNHGNDESAFQYFFERNPSFVPGAFELSGPSGHYPYSHSLISQPEINGGSFRRYPDFIWLAQDSLSFTPVLIEIERPNKETFRQDGTQTADFTQALGQIAEWKALLSVPENVLLFYNCFNIPDRIRRKTFSPQYALIYGRRSEFEGNEFLTRKRAQLVQDNVRLISFDRLRPDSNYQDLFCTKLSHGRYTIKTIPPTYRYSPSTADNLSIVDGFLEAIQGMEHTTAKRKKFLEDRYSYWKDYGLQEGKGIICPSDKE